MAETEADRVARKIERTKDIVSAAQAKTREIAAIPSCYRCVWRNVQPKSSGGGSWEYCRQPMISRMEVKEDGRPSYLDIHCETARKDEEYCGRKGDLFVAKTWWEMNKGLIIGFFRTLMGIWFASGFIFLTCSYLGMAAIPVLASVTAIFLVWWVFHI